MANEPKPQQGTAWCCVCGMDHSNFQGLHSFAGAPSLSSLAYRPETCPHCVAKDAEITQWKEAHDDRVDQYREMEVERDAKDQEIERLKAGHAQAIQQARREVLEVLCSRACQGCADGIEVSLPGKPFACWNHAKASDGKGGTHCKAERWRQAFYALWPEVGK